MKTEFDFGSLGRFGVLRPSPDARYPIGETLAFPDLLPAYLSKPSNEPDEQEYTNQSAETPCRLCHDSNISTTRNVGDPDNEDGNKVPDLPSSDHLAVVNTHSTNHILSSINPQGAVA